MPKWVSLIDQSYQKEGGDQHTMEYEEENMSEDESLLDRIKESPRTVSALIIILIVAAAIYAFSGDETDLENELAMETEQPAAEEQVGGDTAETDEAATEATDDMAEETGAVEGESNEMAAEDASAPESVSREQLQEQTGSLPEARQTDSAYVEVAQQGDGVTHLARRATTRYLSEQQDSSLSNEHRIYIEDYIKDRIGRQGLALGEEVSISFDLVSEAVGASQQLSNSELQNLSQYTSAL